MVRLHQGVGGKGNVAAKFAHPSEHLRAKYPNDIKEKVLIGGVIVWLEQKTVNRRQQLCVVFRHHDFAEIELHTVRRHFVMTQEGNPDLFFEQPNQETIAHPEAVAPAALEALQERAAVGQLTAEEEELARTLEDIDININNDNEPAPENIPDNQTANDQVFNEWGKGGLCNRKKSGATDHVVKLLFGSRDSVLPVFTIFKHFFFKSFIVETILEATNQQLGNGKSVLYSEFFGLDWALVGDVNGHQSNSQILVVVKTG